MWILREAYTSREAIVKALRKYRYNKILNQIDQTMSRKYNNGKLGKRQKIESKASKDGSTAEGVLLEDIRRLLAAQNLSNPEDDAANPPPPPYTSPERFSEIEVKISDLSAAGDGLGSSPIANHVYVVPFTLPGDVVKAKVVKHFAHNQYTLTDFVRVITPGPKRDDSLIKCPYFSTCSGCQLQMMPYEDQLLHKKTIIERAYHNFSSLTPDVVPEIGSTIGSPLQYGYRTKLTPHFDGPPGSMSRKARLNGKRKGFEEVPPIGFILKGTRKTIDIEDCPIGTDAVRLGMKRERERVKEEIAGYKKGATLLLRESTSKIPKPRTDLAGSPDEQTEKPGAITEDGKIEETPAPEAKAGEANPTSEEDGLPYLVEKTCITNSNANAREFIGDFEFANPAGAFFQNNNSILQKFTAYIRDHILLPGSQDDETNNNRPLDLQGEENTNNTASGKKTKHLIDAYCGSGLFTVTLSSLFSSSLGIDISGGSIASARSNALQNKVSNAKFMTADAAALFKEVTFPPDETVVVIDPPRKGCDDAFLNQLLRFGPRRVVYVSCNVHTQARDVGLLVDGAEGGCRYGIESLRGFDFFPQTGHVEAVAVLNRVDKKTPFN